MQKSTSIRKRVPKIYLVLAAKLLQTLAARSLDDHLGNDIVEDYLLKLL